MTTFANLVDDVFLLMQGYGLDNDRAAFITTTALTASATTFTVDSTANLSAGVAEIGDELIYIKAVDDTTKTVTVAPDGRGWRGTVATTHAVDARVTMNPVLPRSLVKRKINETITGLYPNLWGIASTTLTYDPVSTTYALPTEVEDILRVTYRDIGPSGEWPMVNRWRLDTHPDTTTFVTGKTLNIWDGLGGVSDIRVVYTKQPSELSLDSDNLTATGLASTARAVVVAGAAWRLVSFMDASRLKLNSVDMDMVDDRAPIGTATQVGSYLRKQYERELEEEKQRQQSLTPPVLHWSE